MSLVQNMGSERVPLKKLEYDVTPRDVEKFNSQLDSSLSQADFRYRGYPDANFERAKNPVAAPTRSQSENLMNPYYGLNHYFNKGQPKVNGESEGLNYGSSSVLTSKENQLPRIRSLPEKTSAELRKYHKQENEVQKQIDSFREEKLDRLKMLEDTKRKDLEQLKNYNPWGRLGGGAPNPLNDEFLKQKFTEYDAPIQENGNGDKSYVREYGDFHAQFGRPGGGAPLRSESGEVRPELKLDPLIRFQDSTKAQVAVEKEVRYKQKPEEQQNYYSDLENQISARRAAEKEIKQVEKKQDLETLSHHPYGKPGCGAPNLRNQDSRTENRTNFPYYDPWGKGHGAPVYDDQGDVVRHANIDKNREIYTKHAEPQDEGVTLPFLSPRGGGGAPMKTDSGNPVTRMPITMKKGDYGDGSFREEHPHRPIQNWSRDPDEQIYNPWGKPGAGAPLKDKDGDIKASLPTHLQRRNSNETLERKQKYLIDLQQGMQEQLMNKQQQNKELQYGSVKDFVDLIIHLPTDKVGHQYHHVTHFYDDKDGELATLIKRGQVGRPKVDPTTGELTNNPLMSTDVSYEKTRMAPDESRQYHTELERAAYERKRDRELEKMRDQQEARHHEQEMSSVWGRPGGGAPNNTNVKLANMENVIHAPRKEHQQYVKRYLDGEFPHPYGNFTKNTVHSNSNNAYEYQSENKRTQQMQYQLVSPYSTDNAGVF